MGLGRGFTAVARRVPRLAGLVWFSCQLNRKDCRRAMGPRLTTNASVILNSRWYFGLQNYPSRVEVSQPALFVYGWSQTQKKKLSLFSCAAKLSKLQCNTPIYIG